jgi:hypothetical protein
MVCISWGGITYELAQGRIHFLFEYLQPSPTVEFHVWHKIKDQNLFVA